MPIKVGRGRCEVTIDGPLGDGLEHELREALGAVGEVMQAKADGILRTAKRDWPVKSGESRDSLRTSLRVHPGEFKVEVQIYSTLEYVRYVKSTKVGEEKDVVRVRSPFQELLLKPARAAEKELKTDLPAVLGRAIDEAVGGSTGGR